MALQLSLMRGSRSKSVRASPDNVCARFHPNRFTFGGVTAVRMNTAKARRKVNPNILLKPSFESNNKRKLH